MDLMTRRRALLAQTQESGVLATATGNPMTFTTNLARPLHSLTIPFTTIQSGWAGASIKQANGNLSPSITASGTQKGITYTLNDDGTFIINGTATGTVEIVCGNIPILWDGATDYYVSGCPSGGASNTYFIRVASGGSYSRYDTGSGIKLSNLYGNLANKTIHLSLFIMSGVTVNNLVVKPMFNAGASQIDYRPYALTTIPINWQSEAGTILNGTVTLNEGGSADVVNSDTGNRYHLANVGNLTTYLGVNTIWTDTNGTNTAEYWIKNS